MGVKVMAVSRDLEGPFSVLMIGTSHCASNYEIKRECSRVFVLEYVLNGSGHITDGSQTFIASKGDTYLLHSGNYHQLYPSEGTQWNKIWMNFGGEAVEKLVEAYKLENYSYFPEMNILPYMEEIHQICVAYKSNKQEMHNKICRVFLCVLQQMYSEVYLKCNKNKTFAEEVKEYIDNYAGVNISLDDISQRLHCSKSYIIRSFRKKYDTTPYAYIQVKKINFAKTMLTESEMSISEISDQLGFCDSHYFSRFFKQNTQMSPIDYRKITQKIIEY